MRTAMQTRLLATGTHVAMPKRSTDVEQRRGDADDAVEEDLGNEEAQQVGRNGALLGDDGE